jgi:hypothetical protein
MPAQFDKARESLEWRSGWNPRYAVPMKTWATCALASQSYVVRQQLNAANAALPPLALVNQLLTCRVLPHPRRSALKSTLNF